MFRNAYFELYKSEVDKGNNNLENILCHANHIYTALGRILQDIEYMIGKLFIELSNNQSGHKMSRQSQPVPTTLFKINQAKLNLPPKFKQKNIIQEQQIFQNQKKHIQALNNDKKPYSNHFGTSLPKKEQIRQNIKNISTQSMSFEEMFKMDNSSNNTKMQIEKNKQLNAQIPKTIEESQQFLDMIFDQKKKRK